MLALAQEQEAAHAARIAWLPAIANATALLSCFSLIGGVAAPDIALRALTPAVTLFGVGLSLASWAGSLDGLATSQRVLFGQALQKSERANRRYREESEKLLSDPDNVEYKVSMFGEDEAKRQFAQLALDKMAALERLERETGEDVREAAEEGNGYIAEWRKTVDRAICIRGLATYALIGGFAWIVLGHALGMTLQ